MTVVVNFEDRRKKKLNESEINLKRLDLDIKEIDVEKLYSQIDESYKVLIQTTEGNSKEFIRCENKMMLFNELSHIVDSFESKRSAWAVLSKDSDYIYIKEKGTIFKADRQSFESKIKNITYAFALDYIVILEQVNRNTYRLVAS